MKKTPPPPPQGSPTKVCDLGRLWVEGTEPGGSFDPTPPPHPTPPTTHHPFTFLQRTIAGDASEWVGLFFGGLRIAVGAYIRVAVSLSLSLFLSLSLSLLLLKTWLCDPIRAR